ncbi:ABC transporter ATP-binding protein [Colwellia psychrerythraea]|uniref:Iron-chelate-transporting ATPase n=1 Tax=Colwellia psychrerythraea TaxID=28229 RepID=A0A099KNJ1_COLPS|nr:ABC transporter ATP-binding protein [Colwellia psychrerythraea]KGJ91800.1 Iron-chelate-transporting ATPase [Colwellia psychrerythraea]
MSTLLNISQLTWQVPNKAILQDINFNVRKGEVIGIIGPNGAGKTSLLRCITNQNNILANTNVTGSVQLKNRAITKYSAKEVAQHFALVMQKNDTIFALSVQDVMKMGLLPHKTLFSLDCDHDKAQINLALKKVGLEQALKSHFNQLSGGEQQRVLIARALVQASQVLILDEPTNHLDVFYQHQVLQLVNKLNITVIMTVHDLNLASLYCQRLLLLNQGQLISDGSPEEVLTPKQLSQVFGLPCQQSIDAMTGAIQVSFYLKNTDKQQNQYSELVDE